MFGKDCIKVRGGDGHLYKVYRYFVFGLMIYKKLVRIE